MIARYDIVIVGSGLGGSAAAHVLQETGLSVLILERGDFIKQEKENWDVTEVVVKRRYDSPERWLDADGREFSPRIYYNVGGSTKFYGGTALRFRESDFAAWPFGYSELAPWYQKAESLLEVHGQTGEDPTEPPREAFPYPPLEHEPVIAALASRLAAQGLHPIHLPIAVDQGGKGKCVKGSPCDGFPCQYRAKGDAENRLLRPILLRKTKNVTLWTNAYVDRLETGEDGRVTSAHVIRGGETVVVEGGTFILAAGAVNSAVILLKSKSPKHPEGLANSSGQVGRNFMAHNNTVILALSPLHKNPTVFQKTLTIHDFYEWGTMQCRGKVQPPMLQQKSDWFLRTFRKEIAKRSIDFWVMSEDFPEADNRVTVDDQGRIHLARKATNQVAHQKMIRKAKQVLHRAGLPLCLIDARGINAIQHQCGTLKFGNDPKTSVLNPWCRTHDVENLYVMDASFFPSSAAVNPALTILAQALRAAEHLKGSLLAGTVQASSTVTPHDSK